MATQTNGYEHAYYSDKALVQRHHAAIQLLQYTKTPRERLELLAAVVWPQNPRLTSR